MRTPKKSSGGQPHSIDLYVGARLRLRRKALGMTQQALGDALGITFQQIQKYESGANRVTASKLFEIAKVLQATIEYFFEEYSESESSDGPSESEAAVHEFLTTAEGIEIADAFLRIKSRAYRRRIVALVRSLAEDEE